MSWQATKRALACTALLGLIGCSAEAPVSSPELADPQVVIRAALQLDADPTAGRAVFQGWCMHCHGDQASGEPPTDFDLGEENPRRFRGYELNHEEHITVIVQGFVSEQSGNQNMPAFALRLTPQQIADVAAYEQQVMAQHGDYVAPPSRRWMSPDF